MRFNPEDQTTTMPSFIPAPPANPYWFLGMDGAPGGTGNNADAPLYYGNLPKMMMSGFDANDATTMTGNFGPHCRNCHRGSSDCGVCHENRIGSAQAATNAEAVNNLDEYPGDPGYATTAIARDTGSGTGNEDYNAYWKHERTVEWASDWRTNPGTLDSTCSNDGFSWPHRTMGFKLLKDEMWGLDFDGSLVSVGETRDGLPDYISTDGSAYPMAAGDVPLYNSKAEDLDSACLDCHNPNVWNVFDRGDTADPNNRKDTTGTAADDYNDELILRGLP